MREVPTSFSGERKQSMAMMTAFIQAYGVPPRWRIQIADSSVSAMSPNRKNVIKIDIYRSVYKDRVGGAGQVSSTHKKFKNMMEALANFTAYLDNFSTGNLMMNYVNEVTAFVSQYPKLKHIVICPEPLQYLLQGSLAKHGIIAKVCMPLELSDRTLRDVIITDQFHWLFDCSEHGSVFEDVGLSCCLPLTHNQFAALANPLSGSNSRTAVALTDTPFQIQPLSNLNEDIPTTTTRAGTRITRDNRLFY
jgi:hypothetical protein